MEVGKSLRNSARHLRMTFATLGSNLAMKAAICFEVEALPTPDDDGDFILDFLFCARGAIGCSNCPYASYLALCKTAAPFGRVKENVRRARTKTWGWMGLHHGSTARPTVLEPPPGRGGCSGIDAPWFLSADLLRRLRGTEECARATLI